MAGVVAKSFDDRAGTRAVDDAVPRASRLASMSDMSVDWFE